MHSTEFHSYSIKSDPIEFLNSLLGSKKSNTKILCVTNEIKRLSLNIRILCNTNLIWYTSRDLREANKAIELRWFLQGLEGYMFDKA